MNKSTFYLFFILIGASLTSCHLREKIVYFQTDSVDSLRTELGYTPTLNTDDFLSITVYGEDPESVAPFNINTLASNSSNSGYATGAPAYNGYLIDSNGDINMPVLGKIHVGGLTRVAATDTLQNKLKDFVRNPIVLIQIQNYKITVLGDVRNPGTFRIPNERITIVEAIGLAGDLNITGSRKNVLVIRDSCGVKQEFRLDLTDKSIFKSPGYYLRQNDVVYVEPSGVKRTEATIWRATGPLIITITSLIVTTISLLTVNK
jgi:polysaccharide export outer membrane protein